MQINSVGHEASNVPGRSSMAAAAAPGAPAQTVRARRPGCNWCGEPGIRRERRAWTGAFQTGVTLGPARAAGARALGTPTRGLACTMQPCSAGKHNKGEQEHG
jgi:hypothetical protein